MCYQITGIKSSAIGVVSTSCPDCLRLGAVACFIFVVRWPPTDARDAARDGTHIGRAQHFDMSQELADAIEAGSAAAGHTSVSWREVSCGYSGSFLRAFVQLLRD